MERRLHETHPVEPRPDEGSRGKDALDRDEGTAETPSSLAV